MSSGPPETLPSAMKDNLFQAVHNLDITLLTNLLETAGFTNNEQIRPQCDPELNLSTIRDPSGNGNTLLHAAVLHRRRDPKSFEKIILILINDAKLDPGLTNRNDETPLHLFHRCHKISKTSITSTDSNGMNTLNTYHQNATQTKSTITRLNMKDHKSLVDVYLKTAFSNKETCNGSNEDCDVNNIIDKQDKDGCTPLHLAVLQKCPSCIQLLLKYGANFHIKSNLSRLPFVTPNIFDQDPWAAMALESRLNDGVTYDENEANNFMLNNSETGEGEGEEESTFGISFDFSKIISKSTVDESQAEQEMEFIETFLGANKTVKKQILSHPLVSTFVYLKWRCVIRMFELSFMLHIALAILYTSYTMTVYLKNCPYRKFGSNYSNFSGPIGVEKIRCDQGLGSNANSIIILIVAGILSLLEAAKVVHNPTRYMKAWQNYFQIIMILCMILTVWPMRSQEHHPLYSWQYSAAAYGIFHVWSTLMINMGRFPKLGIYVDMFSKVLQNFGYLMLAYSFLLIAFSISFCVVFPDYPPFETIPRAVLKVITMMSGEVDYGDFFYGDHQKGKETVDFIFKDSVSDDLLHPITGHILFGSFVVIVTILLSNLLIGLAVDDIKALAQDAEFANTKREISNIAYLESIIFWSKIPPDFPFVQWLRRDVSVGIIDNKTTSETRSHCSTLFQMLFRLLRNPRRKQSELSHQRKSSDKRQSAKYGYRVSQDDYKSQQNISEDMYLKAVDLIKKRQKVFME